jgi:hypothetical protein
MKSSPSPAVQLTLTEMESGGFHVFIQANYKRKKLRLLLDTGASRSVFDLKRFQKRFPEFLVEKSPHISAGLGAASMEAHTAIIPELKIGPLEILSYEVGLLDLRHVNSAYTRLKIPKIDGVLGSDVLHAYGAIIDYPAQELRFSL